MESPIAWSALPTLTGTDPSEQEALDPEATPYATLREKNGDKERDDSSVTAATLQPIKTFVPPTSFYAKPLEKKEKRKPLWVQC